MSFPFRSDSDPFVISLSSQTFFSKLERIWYTRIILFKYLLLAKDPTSIIGRSPGSSNKSCFYGFPMLQLLYQFDRSGMDQLNIPLWSPVLTLLYGIHSHSALGITSNSGRNSSENPTTSPTSLPPTLSRISIETELFHVLSSIGYSSPFVSPYPILVSISLQD